MALGMTRAALLALLCEAGLLLALEGDTWLPRDVTLLKPSCHGPELLAWRDGW